MELEAPSTFLACVPLSVYFWSFVDFCGFSSSTGVAPLHLPVRRSPGEGGTNGKESGPVVGPLLGNLFQWNRLNRSFVTICYTQIIISMATLAGGETILHLISNESSPANSPICAFTIKFYVEPKYRGSVRAARLARR